MESVPTDSRISWQGKALERSQFRKQLRIMRLIFVGGAEEKPKVQSDLGDSICSQSPKPLDSSSDLIPNIWLKTDIQGIGFRATIKAHNFQKKMRESCSFPTTWLRN